MTVSIFFPSCLNTLHCFPYYFLLYLLTTSGVHVYFIRFAFCSKSEILSASLLDFLPFNFTFALIFSPSPLWFLTNCFTLSASQSYQQALVLNVSCQSVVSVIDWNRVVHHRKLLIRRVESDLLNLATQCLFTVQLCARTCARTHTLAQNAQVEKHTTFSSNY